MPIIDIIQSYVIKGFIILIIIQVMISLQEVVYESSARAKIEQEMFLVASIFSSDVRCIGSDTITTKPYFLFADSTAVTFVTADTNNFGTPVQIGYSLSGFGSSNMLNRSVNTGTPLAIGYNIERFSLSYFDSVGNMLTPMPLSAINRWKIRSVGVLMRMRKSSSLSDSAKATWQARIYPYIL